MKYRDWVVWKKYKSHLIQLIPLFLNPDCIGPNLYFLIFPFTLAPHASPEFMEILHTFTAASSRYSASQARGTTVFILFYLWLKSLKPVFSPMHVTASGYVGSARGWVEDSRFQKDSFIGLLYQLKRLLFLCVREDAHSFYSNPTDSGTCFHTQHHTLPPPSLYLYLL